MFNSNRSRDDRPSMPPAPPAPSNGASKRGMFSVIGPDIVITGSIRATSELHIEGRVEGDVDCGTLAQGADSQIFGSVTAESARLAGAIEGTVRAKLLTVERTARITGDVEYENITIENGGHIDGRLKHMSAITAAPVRAEPVQPGAAATVTVASVMGSN
jgi:cytoskeletal protein CcmA (bactofilin family)